MVRKNPKLRLWTNDNGTCFRGKLTRSPENPSCAVVRDLRWLKYGLGEGISDIIGFKSKEVTTEMVGKPVAIFCAVEVKTPDDRTTDEQANFIKLVNDMGGIAGVAYSVEEADKILN